MARAEDSWQQMDTIGATGNRLESDGFLGKGTEEPSDHQRSLGLTSDRQHGRLSLLDVAAQEFFGGDE